MGPKDILVERIKQTNKRKKKEIGGSRRTTWALLVGEHNRLAVVIDELHQNLLIGRRDLIPRTDVELRALLVEAGKSTEEELGTRTLKTPRVAGIRDGRNRHRNRRGLSLVHKHTKVGSDFRLGRNSWGQRALKRDFGRCRRGTTKSLEALVHSISSKVTTLALGRVLGRKGNPQGLPDAFEDLHVIRGSTFLREPRMTGDSPLDLSTQV